MKIITVLPKVATQLFTMKSEPLNDSFSKESYLVGLFSSSCFVQKKAAQAFKW
jgi:hypothetical protein